MEEMPPHVDERKFKRLIRFEQIYRDSSGCQFLAQPYKIPKIVHAFLTIGSTSAYYKTGSVNTRDTMIEWIIECGYGSKLLRAFAESHERHFSQRKNHVAFLVILCNFNCIRPFASECANYLYALRQATLCLFTRKVYYPLDLNVFLHLTYDNFWEPAYRQVVCSWFTSKTKQQLIALMYFFELPGRWKYENVFEKCSDVLEVHQKRDLARSIRDVMLGRDGYKFCGNSVVDIFGINNVLALLPNAKIAKALSASDRIHLCLHFQQDSFLIKSSLVEILILRKKYEAVQYTNLDISLCRQMSEAYRTLTEIKICRGPKFCLIPCIFQKESKKVDGIMLESTDLATAFIWDFIRHEQCSVFSPLNTKQGLEYGFHSWSMLEGHSITEIQRRRYNPVMVIKRAAISHAFFECFVIVAITGGELPYEKIMEAFQKYRSSVNLGAKLIMVGIDSMEMAGDARNLDNVIKISGVDEGTSALLWDVMEMY